MTFTPMTVADARKLYTPNMVLVGTLIGGVLGGSVLIWANYKALGDQANATKTLFWCLGGFLLLYLIGPFLPDGSSGAMSGAVSMSLRMLSKQYQWQNEHAKASWWLAILIGIASLIPTLILVFGLTLIPTFAFPQLLK